MYHFFQIFLLFLFPSIAIGQIVVKGKIMDVDEVLIGANVVESGTVNGVSTNLDGEFRLECFGENPILEFSYSGYLTKHIPINTDTILLVNLEYDENQECVFSYGEFRFGGIYGFNKRSFGSAARLYLPYAFKCHLGLIADVKWRFLPANDYLNIMVLKRNIFKISKTSGFNISGNIKTIFTKNESYENRQFTITPEIYFNGNSIGIGYGRAESITEDLLLVDQGINIELKTSIQNYSIRGQVIYWFDYWQYYINISRPIPKTRFTVSLGYEAVDRWKELDFSLMWSLYF